MLTKDRLEKQKKRQKDWFNAAFEPGGLVGGIALRTLSSFPEHFVRYYPLEKVIELLPSSLEDKTFLIINAGTGIEAEFFSRHGAQLTVSDISNVAIRTLLKEYPYLSGRVEDSENLSFRDSSFDWVVVNDGLHHLARPLKGFYEMERVAKEGFVFIEAQDSIFMRLLVWIGIADDYEEGPGSYIYRFKRSDVKRICRSLNYKYIIHSAWCQEYVPFFNRYIYPYLNGKLGFGLFKRLFYVVNSVFGYWGNKFIVIILKNSELSSKT